MTANKDFNRAAAAVTGNKTLAAVDCGVVQLVKADAPIFTLPSTAAGLTFTFRNGSTYDGQYGFAISPAAADGITGGGLATPVINKDILVTKATTRATDEITLVGTGTAGTGAWIISNSIGTYTREA